MDDIKRLLEGLVQKLKENKKLELAVYAVMALLCLLLCFPVNGRRKEKEAAAPKTDSMPTELEDRLMDTLSCVRGAGKVKVMITYDTGPEIVPAMSSNVSSGGSGNTSSIEPVTVYQNGENEAIVLMEREPTVRGVIVVAEGAADISVRMKLMAAVQAVLGVEPEQVEVLEMGIKGMEEQK